MGSRTGKACAVAFPVETGSPSLSSVVRIAFQNFDPKGVSCEIHCEILYFVGSSIDLEDIADSGILNISRAGK